MEGETMEREGEMMEMEGETMEREGEMMEMEGVEMEREGETQNAHNPPPSSSPRTTYDNSV